mgnify:FL=1
MNLKPLCGAVAVALGLFLPAPALVHAETLAPQLPDFTYQGRLEDNGVAVNGPVNLSFSLWDSETGGLQIGSTIFEAQ